MQALYVVFVTTNSFVQLYYSFGNIICYGDLDIIDIFGW